MGHDSRYRAIPKKKTIHYLTKVNFSGLLSLFFFFSHFRLYEVVSLHRCVFPYAYRKILKQVFKLTELCGIFYGIRIEEIAQTDGAVWTKKRKK